MAPDASDFGSIVQKATTSDHGAQDRAAFQARPAADRDRRFFLKVADSNEAVTAGLRSSVTKLTESRALIEKINDLLRR